MGQGSYGITENEILKVDKVQGFRITEVDKETLNVSPIKQKSEETEEGVEAISVECQPSVKKKVQNGILRLKSLTRTKAILADLESKLIELEKIKPLEQEVESIFSESDIQRTMALTEQITKTKEEEIKEGKKTPAQPKMQNNEKSLPSNKKVWLAIGVAVLTTVTIYLQFGGMATMLFVCVIVCLGLVYASKKTSNPPSKLEETSTLESFVANNRRGCHAS